MARPEITGLPTDTDGPLPDGVTLPGGKKMQAGSVGKADQNESVPMHLRGVSRPDYIPETDAARIVPETQTYLPAEYPIGKGQLRRDR